MTIISTSIESVKILKPKIFGDERGYFFESFRLDIFEREVEKVNFIQDNQSKSSYGVLRGLHYQKPPFTQGKLVRCIQGEVLDVAVDIRLASPTFGKHIAVLLSDKNQRQLWVPRGFAHGFVVLSETAIFAYKCDNYYSAQHDAGILWNDPQIGIDWSLPINDIILSEKDKHHPLLSSLG